MLFRVGVVALLLAVLLVGVGRAQNKTSAGLPPVPIFNSDVDLVTVSISVEDHGRAVTGLKASDFAVYDDGKLQTVRYFSPPRQSPLTMALLLDTNASTADSELSIEQYYCGRFLDRLLSPRDLAVLMTFDTDARVRQDLTSSKIYLNAALDHVTLGGGNPPLVIDPGVFGNGRSADASRLWDAIYLASSDALADQIGRKAIVVVTAGDEEGSYYTEQNVVEQLLATNTALYAIVPAGSGNGMFHGFSGVGRLRHVASMTGGRFFLRTRHLWQNFNQSARDLDSQYELAFVPDSRVPIGARAARHRPRPFHHIAVRIIGSKWRHAHLWFRRGYFSPKGDSMELSSPANSKSIPGR
jgi:VWFA-related protein